jgi:hypothetical protein
VDWAKELVCARVLAPPDVHGANLAQARLGAQQSLERQAVPALFAQVKDIRVDSEVTLGEELEIAPPIWRDVEAALKKFRVTQRHVFADGGISAMLELPLPVLAAVFSGEEQAPDESQTPQSKRRSPYTGWLLDAHRLTVLKALKPRVLDASMNEVFGARSLWAGMKGSVLPFHYVAGLDKARRTAELGAHPLVLKPLRAQGIDMVISNADARKLEVNPPGYAPAVVATP